ncbi:MAG: hypothetical protein JXA64_06675 [Candidatus Fermentibacteraceae bacterium]|nr:hypothetical protein [Candidatus Fermentibacteraceae bacterium]MBN2608782.1 hypothetical protein [Candidatus Fermentibacteraceae bacterium]
MGLAVPIILVLAIAGGIIWIVLMVEKKRTAAWEAIAGRLGAQFTPKGSGEFTLFPFQLFNSGTSRKMKNHMKWESEGVTVHLADYQYTVRTYTGRSNTSKTYKQTICILEKQGLDLPRTFMRRQVAFLDWMGNKFGAQDINFEEDPEFSKAFVLKGDETRTPQIVGPEMRQHLLQNRGQFKTLEMNGPAIMVNFGKRRKPEEYADLVGLAMPVYYMSSSGGSAW